MHFVKEQREWLMNIEIAWITADYSAQIISVEVESQANVLNVLQHWRPDINWLDEFLKKNVTVWQETISDEYSLQENDRVEWVRNLIYDPKQARFKRLKKK